MEFAESEETDDRRTALRWAGRDEPRGGGLRSAI
jgi:hypothetical protein